MAGNSDHIWHAVSRIGGCFLWLSCFATAAAVTVCLIQLAGFPVPSGVNGPTGDTGALGVTGATGPAGPASSTRLRGPVGNTGDTDQTGATGSTGVIGSTVPKRDQGIHLKKKNQLHMTLALYIITAFLDKNDVNFVVVVLDRILMRLP